MDAEIIDGCQKNDIMVTAYLLTYNHAPYIRQALDAIINQKVNFKIQILVLDDASNDGTSDIIREYVARYPELFTVIIQKENKYQKSISIERAIVPYIYGKYTAFCEGDDYWIGDTKLQKQVDYMETHPDISATGGVSRYYSDEGVECQNPAPPREFRNRALTENEIIYKKKFGISTNTLMTLSAILRSEQYICAREISPKVGDGIIIPYMFQYGDVYIFDEVFQYHRIQTRDNASNYNSIFSTREKYLDIIRVCQAWVTCDINPKYRIRLYIRNMGLYFVLFLRQNDCRFFFHAQKKMDKQYRKYLGFAILYGIIIIFPKMAWRKIFKRKMG